MALNRFGFEWSKYPQIIPLYERQFQGWVYPLTPESFRGKSVLDAGCGTGRNSWWPARYGAARVAAFDVDPRTVAVARQNLGALPSVEVFEGSIYDIPYEETFDIVFSIGVVHHLADPRTAVRQLVKATRKGGTVLVWVYAREGATTLKAVLNAVRRATCRWPPSLLDKAVAPLSFLWYLSLKALPHRHPYLKVLKEATFWHVHSILLDQLLPEIANYWTRQEAEALFEGLSVTDVRSEFRNNGSWTVLARRT